jgi:hypothetical protein
MGTLIVRKNFSFDKDIVDKVSILLQEKNTTFTKLLTNYFQAIIKEPELINEVEQKAKQRTASFIGLLDDKIGDIDAKEMKRVYNENLS